MIKSLLIFSFVFGVCWNVHGADKDEWQPTAYLRALGKVCAFNEKVIVEEVPEQNILPTLIQDLIPLYNEGGSTRHKIAEFIAKAYRKNNETVEALKWEELASASVSQESVTLALCLRTSQEAQKENNINTVELSTIAIATGLIDHRFSLF